VSGEITGTKLLMTLPRPATCTGRPMDPRQIAGVPDQVPGPQKGAPEEDQSKRLAIRTCSNRDVGQQGLVRATPAPPPRESAGSPRASPV
jgi:hypothetical protein